jgi:hypothetical protein
MNYNPYTLEQLANDKLAASRAEGMRSQSLARAGLQLPEIQLARAVFHRIQVLVANFNRRIDQPASQKSQTNSRGEINALERTADC